MLFIYMAMLDSEDEKETFAQIYNTYSQPMYQIAYAVLRMCRRRRMQCRSPLKRSFCTLINFWIHLAVKCVV